MPRFAPGCGVCRDGKKDGAAVQLAILVVAHPAQRFAVVELAFAIQVGIAGHAFELGDGFRGRGVTHHTVQHTVRRTYEDVRKSPGKRNDHLHKRSPLHHCIARM